MNRIRSRVVALGVATALLPALPLSFLVRDLLERSFAGPLGAATANALQAGLEESRERLALEKRRFEEEIRAAVAVDSGAAVAAASVPIEGPERRGDALVATAVFPDGTRRAFERPLPAGLRERAERMTETIGTLRALDAERGAVLRSYITPFLISYAFLVAVAAALGALLARRIARPVEAIAAAAQRVGAGDLATRVTVPASGEVGELVASFNAMAARLESDRAELARLERLAAWRDLAKKLAHEIKNPLTPIQLAVHQAADGVKAADEPGARLLADCREIVDEEIDRLRRLVREFSEFARLPQPQLEPGVLDDVLGDLRRLYGEEKVELSIEASPLAARFDEAEIRRALVNLIDNGLAACREVGAPERVRIAARVAGRAIRIDVSDRGAGIAPASLPRLFEPSFTTKKDGMGLGLAIVEGILRGHAGTVRAASEPGRGATFTLEWPAEAHAVPAQAAAPAPPARTADWKEGSR